MVDIDAVTRVIEDAARTLVMPRFAKLSAGEITAKRTAGDPHDIVTVVDQDVETHLTRALTDLAPATVVGEEAAHLDPLRLRQLSFDAPLWVIDPIDGTKNFAAGRTAFAVMVAWVVKGQTQAAWIVLPARQQTFVAERGGGTFLNGTRLRVAAEASDGLPRGDVRTNYMPPELRPVALEAMRGRFRSVAASGCAGVEYTDIIQGTRDFVVYYRLLPWDHAAPALVLTEAGGSVMHVGGRHYTPRAESQLTVVARDVEMASAVSTWLVPAHQWWQSAMQAKE
jgi:fructose-1,6-bisphosphatase/inositol monophosphatase family enzyme